MKCDVIKEGFPKYYSEESINSNKELEEFIYKNGYAVLIKSDIVKKSQKYRGYKALEELKNEFTIVIIQ